MESLVTEPVEPVEPEDTAEMESLVTEPVEPEDTAEMESLGTEPVEPEDTEERPVDYWPNLQPVPVPDRWMNFRRTSTRKIYLDNTLEDVRPGDIEESEFLVTEPVEPPPVNIGASDGWVLRRRNTVKINLGGNIRPVKPVEPYTDKWSKAFEKEDGVLMLKCLIENPSVVSIRYLGSTNNVLHRAVRNNWYGLVLQVSEMLSHQVLEQQVLEDLLTEKELDGGHKEAYSSGLDVLGMASIQCHKAMNSLLARMIRSGNLFASGHPYSKVIVPLEQEEEQEEEQQEQEEEEEHEEDNELPKDMSVNGYWGNQEGLEAKRDWAESWRDRQRVRRANRQRANRQRKVLTEILTPIFPTLKPFLGLKKAPRYIGGLPPAGDDRDLDQLCPGMMIQSSMILHSWMVTSPFLPLSEYLVLEWSRTTDLWIDGVFPHVEDFECDMLIQTENKNIAFFEYLLQINDTRRTVLHYALADRDHFPGSFERLLASWSDILHQTRVNKHAGASRSGASTSKSGSDFIDKLRNCFQMLDSSGRTPVELFFAVTVQDIDVRSEMKILELFSFFQPLDSQIRRSGPYWHKGSMDGPKHPEGCIDPRIVHEVNGYYFSKFFYSPYVDEGHTVADVVMGSASCLSRTPNMKHLLEYIPGFLPDCLTRRSRIRESRELLLGDQYLTLLQHVVLLGDTTLVRLLAKDGRAYDPARFDNLVTKITDVNRELIDRSALQFAAEEGNPEMIRILLDSGAFDPCYRDRNGDTALHYAARSRGPFSLPVSLYDYVEIDKFGCGNFYGSKGLQRVELPVEGAKQQEVEYQGCLNMLLQAGIDIWQVNNENQAAFLHQDTSPEYRLWWYEKLDRETQEQTAKLTAAANAMSVTAALVATASYIGPLQPPLGYGSDGNDPIDKVQADISSVRVFIVCNTLAFYMALVAIMFSLTPSLPMPQESMLGELKRIRRSVTLALDFLIMAIVTILVAFASASIAVIPESWNHKGLSVGTLTVGGFLCSVVLGLCCIRAIRLMFHKSRALRMFYKRWVKI